MLASKVSSNVNHELQLIIIHQHWLIKYNKCTSLMHDVSNMGKYGGARMREYMRTLCTFCSVISVNIKTTLLIQKNKLTKMLNTLKSILSLFLILIKTATSTFSYPLLFCSAFLLLLSPTHSCFVLLFCYVRKNVNPYKEDSSKVLSIIIPLCIRR